MPWSKDFFQVDLLLGAGIGGEGSWAHAQYSSMLPVGFTWIRYLDSFYRSWDLGTKGIIQRIQRTFPVVRMMKMCWVPKAWYISRSSYKLHIQAALLSDLWQCHHHSLGILGLNQPYVIRNQNSQEPSHLPSSSSARSCLASAELTYRWKPSRSCHVRLAISLKGGNVFTKFTA